jgi:hypothetical protein
MFDNFQRRRISGAGAEINLVMGGAGPPLLLNTAIPKLMLPGIVLPLRSPRSSPSSRPICAAMAIPARRRQMSIIALIRNERWRPTSSPS